MTTVIYHSADFDGIFCREIAKKFLGEKDVQYIGWNFGDPPIELPPPENQIYILDLPVDKPFGLCSPDAYAHEAMNVIWIDHHKSSIESHPKDIPGYRIDGVAACRLAWQWFRALKETNGKGFGRPHWPTPTKEEFLGRTISEPLAVRLAGEYDVWDKRDERADMLQYGLRTNELDSVLWDDILTTGNGRDQTIDYLLKAGFYAQRYAKKIDADLVTYKSFHLKWEGLDFLCLNAGRFNSLTFAALDKPETGHDALLGFMWNGKCWTISLYHAKHRTDLDLSQIAVKHGGGGHRGACGFTCKTLPFNLE